MQALLAGISAAACGAIIAASILIRRDAIRDATQVVITLGALAALLAIRRYKPRRITPLAEPLVVAVAAVVGLARA